MCKIRNFPPTPTPLNIPDDFVRVIESKSYDNLNKTLGDAASSFPKKSFRNLLTTVSPSRLMIPRPELPFPNVGERKPSAGSGENFKVRVAHISQLLNLFTVAF